MDSSNGNKTGVVLVMLPIFFWFVWHMLTMAHGIAAAAVQVAQ